LNTHQVIEYADGILKGAKLAAPAELGVDNFSTYAELVGTVVRSYTARQRKQRPWLDEWAVEFRRLYDIFDQAVLADPMILYRPKHQVAPDFHSSSARVRYFSGGNGTSKTQSGYAEDYFAATGQHKWRHMPRGDVFVIGINFSQYAPRVFDRKMVKGETGNFLSPMFPVGGKWFYHYDERKHIITIACPECAEAGKAGACKHQKTAIQLYSDEGTWEVLQGAQFRLGHFDEHVAEEFYQEAKQRVARVLYSSLIVTGTPLFGMEAWETRLLRERAEGDPAQNLSDPADPSSPPYVSMHEIDQFSAGILPHDVIRGDMQDMDEFEIQARVYGKPSPMTKTPVFDRWIVAEMLKVASEPICYTLNTTKPLEELSNSKHLNLEAVADTPKNWTGLRIWEQPERGAQYIAAVDSARGLIDGDASCCSILKLSNRGMKLHISMAAQFHGWCNAFEYADEVFKLAILYNDALVVIEMTGGFGDPVMLRLKNQLAYWNIFRDVTDISQAEHGLDPRMGIDTNVQSKPMMIAALQQFIKDRSIDVPCSKTCAELRNFEQERLAKDGKLLVTPRFRGAGGAHDDRVMSLAIGVGVAVSYPVFDMLADAQRDAPSKPEYTGFWKDIHEELDELKQPEIV
jgi:hypothetical protein